MIWRTVMVAVLLIPALALAAPDGQDIFAEIEDALRVRASGASVWIPAPSDADKGQFRVNSGDLTSNASFAWTAERFLDAWGREVDGHRLSYTGFGGGAGCSVTVEDGAGGKLAGSKASGLEKFLRFETGAQRPTVDAGALRSCFAGIILGPDGAGLGTGGTAIADYTTWPSYACLFRNAFQGRDLTEGARITGGCEGVDQGATWIAGAITERDGRRAIPLYVTASEDHAARLWLAEGLPYPLAFDLWQDDERASQELVALALDGAPLPPLEVAAPPPAIAGLHPPAPLAGPDDDGADIPARLSDASRAAVSDATLSELQGVLARRDAVLAGAVLRAGGLAGSPSLAPAWTLLFHAPGGHHATVRCQAAATPPAGPALVRCVSADEDQTLGLPPSDFGATGLPPLVIPFHEAVARLGARDVDADSRTITSVSYIAWRDVDGEPRMSVGNVPTRQPAPVGAEAADAGWIAVLDVRTGRSIADLTPRTPPTQVENMPVDIQAAGLSTRGPDAAAPAGPATLPRIAGAAAAAIGIIALALWLARSALIGAFTRLTRPRILDTSLRAELHTLVAERPGIHANEIIRHYHRGNGLIEYHLDVLVREGYLVALKTTGHRHYFRAGAYSPDRMRALATLRRGSAERIYSIIRENPGIGVQAVARQAGVSAGTVSKEVQRLGAAGLVDQVRIGRGVELRAKAES